MSVRDRITDGGLLWEHGRKEGTWIQVLIAAAATAKVRYPAMSDSEGFSTFIRDVMPTLVNPRNPARPGQGITIILNGAITLDRLIYKHLRCYLIHEATIDKTTVALSESREVNGRLEASFGGGGNGSPFSIPDFFVINLAKAVAEAPENAADCAGAFLFPGAEASVGIEL